MKSIILPELWSLPILARLDKVQEELLYYPRRRRLQNVKVFYVMGRASYPVSVTGLVAVTAMREI